MTDKKPVTSEKTLQIISEPQQPDAKAFAEVATGGFYQSLRVLQQSCNEIEGLVITECAQAMLKHAKEAHQGNLKQMETLLVSQAVALDSLFGSMAVRAQSVMGKDQLKVMEMYMRLALKAQNKPYDGGNTGKYQEPTPLHSEQ